jgi:hypothetical protein
MLFKTVGFKFVFFYLNKSFLEFGINGLFRIRHHHFLCRIFHEYFEDRLMEIELIRKI